MTNATQDTPRKLHLPQEYYDSLNDLFTKAKAVDEFEYALTLLRIRTFPIKASNSASKAMNIPPVFQKRSIKLEELMARINSGIAFYQAARAVHVEHVRSYKEPKTIITRLGATTFLVR